MSKAYYVWVDDDEFGSIGDLVWADRASQAKNISSNDFVADRSYIERNAKREPWADNMENVDPEELELQKLSHGFNWDLSETYPGVVLTGTAVAVIRAHGGFKGFYKALDLGDIAYDSDNDTWSEVTEDD